MIVFTGDVNLTDNAFDVGYGVGSSIAKGYNPFTNIQKNHNDYWIGNFEGVCSYKSELKSYLKDCFRLCPTDYTFDELFDCYGVANNHVMEHGPEAYIETIESIRSKGIQTFGSIPEKYIKFYHENRSIGILGFSLRNDNHPFNSLYWNCPEYNEILNEFQKIKSCDYKVAYIHWGVEFIQYPSDNQKRFAHWLIDVGFDLIIGMHPHVLQGYEIYNNRYIFYSLGNFVFNMQWENARYGAIVTLDVKDGNVDCQYIYIDDQYSPKVIPESDVPHKLRFDYLNSKLTQSENIETYCKKSDKSLQLYRRANYLSVCKNIYRSKLIFSISIIKDFIWRRLKMK